jgi:hypothetical protein
MGNKGFSLIYTLKVMTESPGIDDYGSEERRKLRSACMFVALNRYPEGDWVNFANA